GAEPRRALDLLSARQGGRRIIGHQRHDLYARAGGRLRRLAPARPCRLGLGRRAALFSPPGGPSWRGERPRVSWAILDAAREAGAEIGIPKIDDFNRGDNEGSAYFEVNQRRGRRWSAATAFLKPIL